MKMRRVQTPPSVTLLLLLLTSCSERTSRPPVADALLLPRELSQPVRAGKGGDSDFISPVVLFIFVRRGVTFLREKDHVYA